MSDYKERMMQEYQELKQRYDSLHKMLVKLDAGTLDFTPTCPLVLLKEQADVMNRYMYILEVRAEVEGIGVDNLYG
jgi:hypothetical protein